MNWLTCQINGISEYVQRHRSEIPLDELRDISSALQIASYRIEDDIRFRVTNGIRHDEAVRKGEAS